MARTTAVLSISLPPEMVEMLDRIRKEEYRTRSELVRAALRLYAVTRQRSSESPSERRL